VTGPQTGTRRSRIPNASGRVGVKSGVTVLDERQSRLSQPEQRPPRWLGREAGPLL